MGRLPRAAATRMKGLGERAARSAQRAARKIVAECVEDGLLVATSSRADPASAFAVHAAAFFFPHLFEINGPGAVMRETLERA